MKNLAKNFVFILLIFLIISSVFALFAQPSKKEANVSLTQLIEKINQGQVKEITISGQELSVLYQDGKKAKSRKAPETDLHKTLTNWGANEEKLNQVNIKNKPEKQGVGSWLMPLLIFGLLPLLVFGIFFWMIFRQAKSGATQAFSFT
jgi:cell division protease FtsH